MSELTATRLRELFFYDPKAGNFIRRAVGLRRHAVETGSPDAKGYLRIFVDGRSYRAHRLAFLYMTGSWPQEQVDHINGRVADNRWANLRPATQSQNRANGRAQARNKTGLRGVTLHKRSGKYRARIMHNGRPIDLGLHATPEEATAAYREAASKLFGEFARASGAIPVPSRGSAES